MAKTPPFTITADMLRLSQKISWELGNISGAKLSSTAIILRRINNVKTIQASLAIEGNTLGIDQITAILEGKRVVGPQKDIAEAKNAIDIYSKLSSLNPLSINDLLKAHSIMMKGLMSDPGNLRSGNVGVFAGDNVVHMAPSAKMVPELINNLFSFLKTEEDLPWLIRACVFHYELEFIHPFSDGNGRMGRLWQQLLLMKEDPIFEYVPVETLIRKNQKEYYLVLGNCDKEGESTKFITFSLEQILAALVAFQEEPQLLLKGPQGRLDFAKARLQSKWFSRADYLKLNKDISTATASRDIHFGLENNILKQKGVKNQARYYFIGYI